MIDLLTFMFERDPQAERDTGLVLVGDLMIAGPERPKLAEHLVGYLTELNNEGRLPEKLFGWWPNEYPTAARKPS